MSGWGVPISLSWSFCLEAGEEGVAEAGAGVVPFFALSSSYLMTLGGKESRSDGQTTFRAPFVPGSTHARVKGSNR